MKITARDWIIAGPKHTQKSKTGKLTKTQKLYHLNGEFLTLNQIAKRYDMSYFTLRHRIVLQGMTPEDAVADGCYNGRERTGRYTE